MSGRRHDIVGCISIRQNCRVKPGVEQMQKLWEGNEGLVARMKQHNTDCIAAINLITDVSNRSNTPIPDIVQLEEKERATSPIRLDPPTKIHKPVVSRMESMDNFVMQTSGNEKTAIDLQIARFVCATNSSFSIVEHPEFLKLITMLRPGYQPPSRHKISNGLFDDLYFSM